MGLALAALEHLKRLEAPLLRRFGRDRFYRVEVETQSRCSRGCRYCPVAVAPRPDHRMPEALFRSIVDQLAELGFAGRFSPHFFGEPLLDARLPELMRYVRASLPRATIVIYTNGDALGPDKARALLDAGVDLFLVTFEDGESRAFRQTRASLGWWTMRRRFVVRHFDRDVKLAFNRGGTVLFPGRELHHASCILPTSTLVVDAWGKVKLCANDYDGVADWGDLATERIADVWANPAYRKLRNDVLRGRFEKAICRVCVGMEPATTPLAVYAS
ncbi:MAG: radical SAM/SPASM domain-containing protein [Myxococcota bacterium]